MRLATALLAGGLFGAGLVLAGMTDTRRVQGFLDLAGHWDPTLAFVMGGAILPTALAWRIAGRRRAGLAGAAFADGGRARPDLALLAGSLIFGIGWALAGLCPGPALAVTATGGAPAAVFLIAMAAGMVAAIPARRWTAPAQPREVTMDIRRLTDAYAVSPQIAPEDCAAIRAAGFTTLIDNRPDAEIPPHLHGSAMRAAAEAAGLRFVVNPVVGGAMTMDNVTAQGTAIAAAEGPVLAYCASGNRSSQVWALSQAGRMAADDLIGIPARFGYQLEGLRPQIEALARKG